MTQINGFEQTLVLLVLAAAAGCSASGFALEAREVEAGYDAARSLYSGAGLAARSTPGVDRFEIGLPEGDTLAARRTLSAGGYTLSADTDFDGTFDRVIDFPASGVVEHVVRPGGRTAVRLRLRADGKVEYRIEPVFTTTLSSAGEELDVVAALLPPHGAVLFGDPQRDGTFSMYIAPKTVFGLGGAVYTASVVYDPPRVVLAESDVPTTQPGDVMPSVDDTALGRLMSGIEPGEEIVLVFAHPQCRACIASSPLADLARQSWIDRQRWVWVVRSEDQVEPIGGSVGERQSVVADSALWNLFGASATPTLLRLSPAGENGGRTIVSRVSSGASDPLRQALGWD